MLVENLLITQKQFHLIANKLKQLVWDMVNSFEMDIAISCLLLWNFRN